MLHFLLNLCAFCRLASRLVWDCCPCPAPAQTAPARPAGETDNRHGTRAASPAAYRRRARHAQHPGQTDTPPLCRQPARPDQTDRASRRTRGHPEEKRGRERKETGRKNEDLRPFACRIAAQVIKASNPAQSQPDRSQRRRPAGTPPATVPNSSPVSFSARFQFCFWRVCRTPARFRPSADEQRHPARLPGRHRHRGSLHIFAPAPFLTKRLSTSTLSRTPHISIFHSGSISTIPQQ